MSLRENAREGVISDMDACGIQKIESPWFVLALQKNPAAFKEEIVTVKLDKAGTKRALEAGESVPGAALTRSTRLAVR